MAVSFCSSKSFEEYKEKVFESVQLNWLPLLAYMTNFNRSSSLKYHSCTFYVRNKTSNIDGSFFVANIPNNMKKKVLKVLY
jgi:hypothetical protein